MELRQSMGGHSEVELKTLSAKALSEIKHDNKMPDAEPSGISNHELMLVASTQVKDIYGPGQEKINNLRISFSLNFETAQCFTCSFGPSKVAGLDRRWLFMAATPSGRSLRNQGCCQTPCSGILARGSATSSLDNRSLHSGDTFTLGGKLYSTLRILCTSRVVRFEEVLTCGRL